MMKIVHLIFACDENGGFSKDNDIPWKCKNDLKFFKKTTINKTVVMGRKTWESLPNQYLPKRKNIVLSHSELNVNGDIPENLFRIERFEDIPDQSFVIGGIGLIEYFLKRPYLIGDIYITTIKGNYACDQFIDVNKIREMSYPPIEIEKGIESQIKTTVDTESKIESEKELEYKIEKLNIKPAKATMEFWERMEKNYPIN